MVGQFVSLVLQKSHRVSSFGQQFLAFYCQFAYSRHVFSWYFITMTSLGLIASCHCSRRLFSAHHPRKTGIKMNYILQKMAKHRPRKTILILLRLHGIQGWLFATPTDYIPLVPVNCQEGQLVRPIAKSSTDVLLQSTLPRPKSNFSLFNQMQFRCLRI